MEILGLLDTLEALILDGVKIPLTKRTLIKEEQALSIIDKIRLVLHGGSDFAKKAIDKDRGKMQSQEEIASDAPQGLEFMPEGKGKASEIVQNAYQIAKEIRQGADKYADEVLSNIELTSTRVLRTVKAGRERLQQNVQGKEEVNV